MQPLLPAWLYAAQSQPGTLVTDTRRTHPDEALALSNIAPSVSRLAQRIHRPLESFSGNLWSCLRVFDGYPLPVNKKTHH